MRCEDVDLVGFVGAELSAPQTSAAAEHLEQCGDCQDRLRLLLEMRRNRRELGKIRRGLQRRVYAWPIAAGLLLASLAAYWLVRFPYDVRSLAVSTPYPMAPPQLRSPQMPEPLVTAARAYSQNNWPEAEADLTRFLAGNPADYEATFYLANVFYVRGRLAESERLFRELNGRDPRDQRVQWYLANLRLRAGDSAGAARRLEMIRESPGEYRSEAESLLRRLRR